MSANALSELAFNFLNAATTALSVAGRPVPQRVYVSDGPLVEDSCDSVFVIVDRVHTGTPEQEAPMPIKHNAPIQRAVELTVGISRCVPVSDQNGNPPTVAAIDAAAHELLRDGWALFTGILNEFSAGGFLASCDLLTMQAAQGRGPDGGVAAWEMKIGVSI